METALAKGPIHHFTQDGKFTLCGEKVSRVVPTPSYAIVLCRICINEMVGVAVRSRLKGR